MMMMTLMMIMAERPRSLLRMRRGRERIRWVTTTILLLLLILSSFSQVLLLVSSFIVSSSTTIWSTTHCHRVTPFTRIKNRIEFAPAYLEEKDCWKWSLFEFDLEKRSRSNSGGRWQLFAKREPFVFHNDEDDQEEEDEMDFNLDLDVESLWDSVDYDDEEEDEDEDEDDDDDDNVILRLDTNPSKEGESDVEDDDDDHMKALWSSKETDTIHPTNNTSTITPSPSPSYRGVGRQGYNLTLLSECKHDVPTYHLRYQDQLWSTRLSLLSDYRDKHGHINVPFRYAVESTSTSSSTVETIHLGRWLNHIRTLYRDPKKKQSIPTKYRKQLNEWNMNWEGVGAGRRPAAFQKKVEDLRKYRKRFGHCNVPRDWEEDPGLGSWVERQRVLYRKRMRGRKSQLTDERVEMLRDVGFEFGSGGDLDPSIRTRFEEVWMERLEALKEFKETHGHCHVPIAYTLDPELGYWVLEQRRQYGLLQAGTVGGSGGAAPESLPSVTLTPERLAQLTDVQFDFSLPYHLSSSNSDKRKPVSTSSSTMTNTIGLPWNDIAVQEYDTKKMLQLMKQFYESDAKIDIAHLFATADSNTATSDQEKEEALHLYSFVRRLRWEYKHEQTRIRNVIRKSPSKQWQWILNEDDVSDYIHHHIPNFDWVEDTSATDTTAILPHLEILQKEYDWWENYHDMIRYQNERGDMDLDLDPKAPWYTEKLVDWFEEQKESYQNLLKEGVTDTDTTATTDVSGTSPATCVETTEWHHQCLSDAGLDFTTRSDADDARKGAAAAATDLSAWARNNVKGRKPAVISLESDDVERSYAALPTETQNSLVKILNNGKLKDRTEELAWLVRYESLRRYYSNQGPGTLADIADDDLSGQRLVLWAKNQRKQYDNYRKGKKSAMTRRRIMMLEEIDFDWEVTESGSPEEWEDMLSALRQFKEKFGHCFVPAVYPGDRKLGQWVHLQRQLYVQSRRAKNMDVSDEEDGDGEGDGTVDDLVLPYSDLTDEHIHELMDIGLDLTMDNMSFGRIAYETLWQARVEELRDYKETYGHCNVPLDYTSPYYDLALWTREQQILYLRHEEGIASQLDKRRIADLECLGFSWEMDAVKDEYGTGVSKR